MLTWIAVFALSAPLVASRAADQAYAAPDLAAQIAAMAKLSFLTGNWQGSGFIEGERGRLEFRQTEKIAMRQQGAVLSIQGQGTPVSAPAGAKPAFEADALLSYDDAAGEYRFYSIAQGRSGTFKAELTGPTSLRWYPGPVRYTITIDSDGRWHETGERNDKDGYVKFFEMTLQRSN